MKQNTEYKHINTNESTHSVTKPNPENVRTARLSQCAYDCAQLQHTIKHRCTVL